MGVTGHEGLAGTIAVKQRQLNGRLLNCSFGFYQLGASLQNLALVFGHFDCWNLSEGRSFAKGGVTLLGNTEDFIGDAEALAGGHPIPIAAGG